MIEYKNDFGVSDLNKIAIERTIPLNVTIELLSECNLKCEHCYLIDHSNAGLSKDEIMTFLTDLRKLGGLNLLLTGGEIFLRPDIMEIIQFSRRLGYRVVLFSNATVITEEQIYNLKKLYIEEFSCTIYSMDQDIHDSITKVKGSLHCTLNNLNLLKKSNIKIGVKTPVMKKNKSSVWKIAEFCKEHNYNYMAPPTIIPRIDGDKSPLKYKLDFVELEQIAIQEQSMGLSKRIVENKWDSESYICDSIHNSIFLDSNGNVYPCNSFYYNFGNIRRCSVLDIWDKSIEHKYLLSLKKKDVIECIDCRLKDFCERCPGNSFTEKNNVLGCSAIDYENAEITKTIALKGGENNVI